MIKTVSEDQVEIIKNIVSLHGKGVIQLDCTYSKGNFYRSGRIPQPLEKYDLCPQTKDTLYADAKELPRADSTVESIMFDPPFLAGYTKQKPSGIIGKRFHGFRYMSDVWNLYELCLVEFYRVLKKDGILIFKCQDTVSSGKQFWSHVHVINEAERIGFKLLDLFVLVVKNRIVGHNHTNQKHARKFHSYFLVFKKAKL